MWLWSCSRKQKRHKQDRCWWCYDFQTRETGPRDESWPWKLKFRKPRLLWNRVKHFLKNKYFMFYLRNATPSYRLVEPKRSFNKTITHGSLKGCDPFSCMISVFNVTDYHGDLIINNASLNGYFDEIYNQTVTTSSGRIWRKVGSDYIQIAHQ